MPVYWRKMIRDLGREKTRSIAVILAITIGVGAFSTVLSTYGVLLRELNEGYLGTHPASGTIQTDRVDPSLLALVLRNPNVAQAEARRVLSGRVKAGPAEWRNLLLFVIEDYRNIRVSRVVPEAGAWPPGPGEMLLERDAFGVARATLGDTLTVKTARGAEVGLRVSGRAHDFGQAQARMENLVYGYISAQTLSLLGEDPFLDRILFVASGDALDPSRVRRVAEEVRIAIEGAGHPIVRLDVPPPGKHPHADLMGLLLLLLAAFGLLAVGLSGIVVGNVLTAVVASEIRQVGVMKAIGGTSGQIARIYLGEALLLGLGGLALGVPLGAWGGGLLTGKLAVFLNCDIRSFRAPAWVYGIDAVVGLLVPCLAAAYPVFKGARVPVREALADWGTSRTAFEPTALDRALGRMKVSRPFLLVLRNAFRRPGRAALTVATLAVAGLFFMSALNIRSSLVHTLDLLFAQARFDLSVSLASMYPVEKAVLALKGTPGLAKVEGWINTEASLAPPEGAPSAPAGHGVGAAQALHGLAAAPAGEHVTVLGVPAETSVWAPTLLAGRALARDDRDGVVINSGLATKSGRGVGEKATFQMGPHAVSLPIVGISWEPFAPPLAYVPLAFFEDHGHQGLTNSLRVSLEPGGGATLSRVREELDRRLEHEGVRALASATKADRRYGFDQHLLMIYVFLVVTSAILGGVGALSLVTTMTLGVLERRRELGILRALGGTPATVACLIAAEGVVLSTLAWAIALLLAWPVSQVLGNVLVQQMFKTHLTFRFDGAGAAVWLLVSLVVGVVASLLPAWRGARVPVREALGYE